MKKILIITNSARYFLSHRLPVAEGARRIGFDVHIATPEDDDVENIKRLGFEHHVVSMTRSGQNLIEELRSLISLYRVIRSVQPEIVHLVTIKPVLYGGLICRIARVNGCVAAISGLGVLFVDGQENTFTSRLVRCWYRIALKHPNSAVIFQNPDDKNLLSEIGAVRESQVRFIRGSGVDLEDCPFVPEPSGRPIITMAARLLRDKGVYEFVEAARILQKRSIDVEFWLIGEPDSGNPKSITSEELAKWSEIMNLRVMGYRDDVSSLYAQSNVVTLPSYYGEGLPKSLIEAAACGRAIVTTDMPGCRDAIEPDKTGLLVPARDAVSLANTIQYLIENPVTRQAMGRAGREFAEREFTIQKVVDQHLEIYRELEHHIG